MPASDYKMISRVLTAPHRRLLARPKLALFAVVAVLLLYIGLLRNEGTRHEVWRQAVDISKTIKGGISPSTDEPSPPSTTPEAEAPRMSDDEAREQFKKEWEKLGKIQGAIYGKTLSNFMRFGSKPEQVQNSSVEDQSPSFNGERAQPFNPYPKYNSPEWSPTHAVYVPCLGPNGTEVGDIMAFKGHAFGFPDPGFGSYNVLGLDRDMCFERETRFGQYGLGPMLDWEQKEMDWTKVDWGGLQEACVLRNSDRFDLRGPPNNFLTNYESKEKNAQKPTRRSQLASWAVSKGLMTGKGKKHSRDYSLKSLLFKDEYEPVVEQRTALLLRSFTGKKYNDNDLMVMRSLIMELSLRSGGEYQVFLFIQVKEDVDIWASDDNYRKMVEQSAPKEFWSITILWNDAAVKQLYPKMPDQAMNVHTAQWLSVQMFMQEHREFDHVWNWEMDARVTGHHYDMLTKLSDFSKKQPRKGLWERNERFYIPSIHGDYDTKWRKTVEDLTIDDSVWGAPNLTYINPVGPTPPVEDPKKDKYKWGVGEEADVIMLSPIFNPVDSGWVMTNQVWGYGDEQHKVLDTPRRGTIVTQSRVSRRLLDIMHVENMRGNHVASEMTPQTVALLHGLKGVYAPMPVFFDRAWTGEQLAKWFNGGPKGVSGSHGSAMGWGREGRYEGSTWYYRASPPQRLYNTWMGNEDFGFGGDEWEETHGRPCLPAMFLHPIKDVKPTKKGHVSISKVPFGSIS